MPEVAFDVQWPDGHRQSLYSPSLVVEDFFSPGTSYPLDDFVARSREAMSIASDRVREKYGFPCSRAAATLAAIEAAASSQSAGDVTVTAFHH